MKIMRIYEHVSLTVADGAEGTETVFTSTNEVSRKLIGISADAVTSALDILVYDERELICDIPADTKAIGDKYIEFDREIEVGHQLKVGFRNGTGGSITQEIAVVSDIS